MNPFQQLIFYLLAAAFLQNMVLSAGFGTSIMLRIVRRPGELPLFTALLGLFSLLTVLIAYPVDLLLKVDPISKLFRPLIMVAIAAGLYIGASLLLKKKLPPLYRRLRRMLPLAALNNMVVGVALVVNHQFALSLPGAIGLSLGSTFGFFLLSVLTAEAREKADNPDVPQAFRGMPLSLVYLGILALAVMGFTSGVSFV
ncbi:MAG: hypothetical protein HFJ80_01665 [Clostridiales bacterium]|nr:hypothetical protein [Clostridiales bacterium]